MMPIWWLQNEKAATFSITNTNILSDGAIFFKSMLIISGNTFGNLFLYCIHYGSHVF